MGESGYYKNGWKRVLQKMKIIKKENEILVLPTENEVMISLAEDFTKRAILAASEKVAFTVVLAGGNTPKLFFDRLVTPEFAQRIPWANIHFFFGDERYVSSDNPKSNYHMAFEHLFSKVPIPLNNIYRIPIEFGYAEDVAKEYERILRIYFMYQNALFPHFDLVYLGLGEDGHTASLMPRSTVVENYCKNKEHLPKNYPWVASVQHYSEGIYQRITLTPPSINHAQSIIFAVTGASKAHAVSSVLEGPFEPEVFPAELIHGTNSKTIWFLDKAAAGQL